MSQFLSQIPRQQLQQQQRLTPQQIQSLHILQLNSLALDELIEQELDSNPALERGPSDEAADLAPVEPADPQTEAERPLVIEENGNAEEFARLDNLVSEYNWLEDDYELRPGRSAARTAEEGDTKLEAMSNTPERPISLQEYLSHQWALADVNEEARRIGYMIIESLSENGRLEVPLEEVAARFEPRPAPEAMAEALRAVQQLDPPGIAARSVQECLLLQLQALPGENELEKKIVTEHFEELQRNRIPQIAEELDTTLEEVKAAIHVISRLSLHPGPDVIERRVPLIVPDIVVEQKSETGEYDIRLTRGGNRELRISPEFREALEGARGDRRTREFLKEKIDAAKAIIDAVQFRRDRLLEVAKAVVAAQRDFLEHGEQHLRVLKMSELAGRLGCDPSTISRTVDEKYIQTPRGIYPLRRFFTGGAERDTGEAIGWDSIKAKVEEIVRNEDKKNPLNDDEIVEALRRQGIDIKRRTVAKYRQQLDIPTARQRREY